MLADDRFRRRYTLTVAAIMVAAVTLFLIAWATSDSQGPVFWVAVVLFATGPLTARVALRRMLSRYECPRSGSTIREDREADA